MSRTDAEKQNDRLKLIIKDQEKVITQLQAKSCNGSPNSESSSDHSYSSSEKPQLRKARGKIIYATMQNSGVSQGSDQELPKGNDTTRNDERMVVRTQDENYAWKSFDVSSDQVEPVRTKLVSIKETAKFVESSDTERKHVTRTEVLRDEIVALDQEIGELHKNINNQDDKFVVE